MSNPLYIRNDCNLPTAPPGRVSDPCISPMLKFAYSAQLEFTGAGGGVLLVFSAASKALNCAMIADNHVGAVSSSLLLFEFEDELETTRSASENVSESFTLSLPLIARMPPKIPAVCTSTS